MQRFEYKIVAGCVSVNIATVARAYERETSSFRGLVMRDNSSETALIEIEYLDPQSFFCRPPRYSQSASNSNRPGGHVNFPFGYNPKAVAEAERLAVEAMYLGADILETLKHVDRELRNDLAEETAKLAKTLMFWGVGAVSLAGKST
jgi:hypothetical protein